MEYISVPSETRPVWTGFKIAVRRKLPTHNYKVRCIDILQNSKRKTKQIVNIIALF